MRFGDALSARWDAARTIYRLLLPVRFSFLTLLVTALVLHFTDQGKDAIAALAEGNATWTDGSVVCIQLLFTVLVALFAMQTWYWSRQLLRVQFRDQPDPTQFPFTVRWIPRLLGLAVIIVVLAALARVRGAYDGVLRKPASALLWLILALVFEAAVFIAFVILRRKRLNRKGPLRTVQRLSELGSNTRKILVLTVLFAVIVFFASTFAVQQVARIGSISVLLTALGFWVALGGVIVYVGTRLRVPILTWLFLFAILISPLSENHDVRTIPGELPPRPDVEKAFAAWYARLVAETPNAPTPRPVFIIASEGGGVRAAYWTAAVLTSLDDTVPGFTAHTFAISGVSGGSIGAGTYRALLAEPSMRGNLRRRAREALAVDALSPAMVAFLEHDFVQRFVPLPIFPDRARALEEGWELGWTDAVGTKRYGDGFLATTMADASRFPALLFNSTIVETGQRGITSNMVIDKDHFPYAVDTFPLIGADVPMSTAAHNSSRFPYISPIGGMRDRHIADGGYFENSGATTAEDLVAVVKKLSDARPYVIFIDCTFDDAAGTRGTMFANELVGPPLTFLNTYYAHATSAAKVVKAHIKPNSITFSLVQHKGERFPLGWLLAARTRDLMDRQMGPASRENGESVRAIAALLGVTPSRDWVWEEAMGATQAPEQKRDSAETSRRP